MPSTDRHLHCVQCIFVWSSGFHLNFSSGHQDVVYLLLSSRNNALDGAEIYIDHTNIAKYFQNFPVNDVLELVFFVYQGA